MNNEMKLKVKKLNPEAILPTKAKPGDAGYDLTAIDDGTWNSDGTYIEYKTGLAIEVPDGYHTELFPRSSITKTDLILGNSIGLVDNGYRGELMLRFKVASRGQRSGRIDQLSGGYRDVKVYKKGDKIAQLVIRKTEELEVEEVLFLSDTERGSGGFGSTDKK